MNAPRTLQLRLMVFKFYLYRKASIIQSQLAGHSESHTPPSIVWMTKGLLYYTTAKETLADMYNEFVRNTNTCVRKQWGKFSVKQFLQYRNICEQNFGPATDSYFPLHY